MVQLPGSIFRQAKFYTEKNCSRYEMILKKTPKFLGVPKGFWMSPNFWRSSGAVIAITTKKN